MKVLNDAAMQALGSYEGGTMLFLGLGTGLGSTLIVRGHIVPMELGALSYGKNGRNHRGLPGRSRAPEAGKEEVAQDRRAARGTIYVCTFSRRCRNRRRKRQEAEEPPPGCRLGSNDKAFIGGFRMWEPAKARPPQRLPQGLVLPGLRKQKQLVMNGP